MKRPKSDENYPFNFSRLALILCSPAKLNTCIGTTLLLPMCRPRTSSSTRHPTLLLTAVLCKEANTIRPSLSTRRATSGRTEKKLSRGHGWETRALFSEENKFLENQPALWFCMFLRLETVSWFLCWFISYLFLHLNDYFLYILEIGIFSSTSRPIILLSWCTKQGCDIHTNV